MASKLLAWFVTTKGKNFTFRIACTTTVAISTSYILPNTWLMDYYKKFVHLYKSGILVQLHPRVLERVNKALELLNIPEKEKKNISSFAITGFDVYHIGTVYSKFGGLIGIPGNYSLNDTKGIQKSDILVNCEPVDFSKKEAQDLLDTLILSEKAQLFGISKEILAVKSCHLFFRGIYSTFTFIFMYGMGNYLNTKYNLYAKPFALRFSLYTLITIFGYGIYSVLMDSTQIYYDKKFDRILSEKNPVYIEGGKEYYDKLVRRNIALRKLMGTEGEKKFTILGNENYLIRQRSLPLVTRRDFFINKSEHLQSSM